MRMSLFLLTLLALVRLASAQPTAGLVAMYHLNGDAIDTSGNGHHGTIFNATPTADRFGNPGNALYFNGTDARVEFGNWFTLPTFSLSLWVKPDTFHWYGYVDIIDNNHTDWRGWVVQNRGDGSNHMQFGTSRSSGGVNQSFLLTTGRWHHLVCTKDSTCTRVYLDRQLVDSTASIGGPFYDGTQQLGLARWGGGGRFWHGELDEFRIYNRALTTEEITGLDISLRMIAPVGGSVLTAFRTTPIRWQAALTVPGPLQIELNRDYPAGNWDTLFTNVSPADTERVWSVTGPATTTARLRIRSTVDTNIFAVTSLNFTIQQPALTLQTPLGGERWLFGSAEVIRWSSALLTDSLLIDHTDGAGWQPLATVPVSADSFVWTVSGNLGNTHRIRIRSSEFAPVADSSAPFTVVQPFITLRHPNGGDTLTIGRSDTLRWQAGGGIEGALAILLNRDYPAGNWDTLFTNVSPADTERVWSVTGPATTTARLRIQHLQDSSLAATSAASFVIEPASSVTEPASATPPADFAITSAHPNPFNGAITVGFAVPQAGDVRVTVHDVLGRTVATLADDHFAAGHYAISWQPRAAPSGTYFVTLRAAATTRTRKIEYVR